MVKLTGPGLGRHAAGSVGGQIIFSNWKGRGYLKQHRSPKQPRTQNQVSMRLMLSFLSTQWKLLDPADKQTWLDLAQRKTISPFNAYNGHNLHRWRNFDAPSKVYPATETGTSPIEVNWAADCLGDHAIVRVQFGTIHDAWALALFTRLYPETPDKWFELINLQKISAPGWKYFTFRPDESGRYTFAFHAFTTDGKFTRDAPKLIGNCLLTV